MTEQVTTRRDALSKAGVGATAAGVAWAAPRVDGLTLRPDYADAQTGPGDVDAPGTTFDVAVGADNSPFSANRTIISPAPGITTANVTTGGSFVSSALAYFTTISGPAAASDCFITGIDFGGNAVVGSPFSDFGPSPVPGALSGLGRSHFVNSPGTANYHLHVTCS